ncbi:hypothetical protein S1OALGB6SA_1193 [Olavius algarvensis spirochete endosymbiont]|nr:hypothetical protein S1OALGB6SA_1193 [Olavius algarvensis spirochete endosymbiont]
MRRSGVRVSTLAYEGVDVRRSGTSVFRLQENWLFSQKEIGYHSSG